MEQTGAKKVKRAANRDTSRGGPGNRQGGQELGRVNTIKIRKTESDPPLPSPVLCEVLRERGEVKKKAHNKNPQTRGETSTSVMGDAEKFGQKRRHFGKPNGNKRRGRDQTLNECGTSKKKLSIMSPSLPDG